MPNGQAPPTIAANKTANTITVRATNNVMAIIERIVDSNDNPRAEVMVDVQILEVNKQRTKQFGLDLGDYAINATFSPEVDPRATSAPAARRADAVAECSTPNTVSRGVSAQDFYLSGAVGRRCGSSRPTPTRSWWPSRSCAGAEGTKLTLNLGEEVPVPSHDLLAAGAGRTVRSSR